MRDWLSAAEIAEERLPGLPTHRSAIARRAEREGWQHRERQASGGGREYAIEALPAPALAKYLARHQQTFPAPAAAPAADEPKRAALWESYERAKEPAKAEAARRLAALQQVERLVGGGVARMAAYDLVAGELQVAASSLRNWQRLTKGLQSHDWLAALLPQHKGRVAEASIDERFYRAFLADWLRLEPVPAIAAYDRVCRKAEAEGWAVPALSTLMRHVRKRLGHGAITLARKGTEAYKRAFPAQRRDRSVFHALQALNADAHTWDVFVKWPDGTVGRPSMLAVQDLHSGACLGWRLDKTPNADVVRLAFGDVFEQYGIPDALYIDNGREFAAKWLTGGMAFRHRFKRKAEEPLGLFVQLGIDVRFTNVYSGQSKPIERMFGDFERRISTHPAFAGAYTGNKPTAKPENYGSKAVPLETFLAVLEEEIRAHNLRQGRRPLGGRSLWDAFTASYETSVIRKVTERQRNLWLLAAEHVTASQTDGSISFFGNSYFDETVAIAARGQRGRVTVRFDPQRLHEGLHVYSRDGAYLGFAPAMHAIGFNDSQAAREVARLKKQRLRKAREVIALEKREGDLRVAARSAPVPELPQPGGQVVRLVPTRQSPASSAAAAAALSEEERHRTYDEFMEALAPEREKERLRLMQGP